MRFSLGFFAGFEPPPRFFVLFFISFEGIICPMTSRLSFLKTTALFTALIYVSGMVITPLVPKAQALFWEDDTDSNDPKEVKSRPSHFFLFDWVDDLNKDAKKSHYKDLDNHDKGPSVNNDARTLVIVASGIVGLGLGIFIANRLSQNSDTASSDMFIGGALGLGSGVLIGALIMPQDYDVDRQAKINFMKDRQAWLQDPVRLQISRTFHPVPLAVSFKF